MPLTVRTCGRRRKKNPDEKLPERPGESTSSAQVMAPTRMKLRVRRRDNAASGVQPDEAEERSGSRSSRRKNTNNTSTATAAATSPPPSSSSSSASASARAVMAAEDASPDSKCPICLDRFNNLAYLDRCLHRFCFPCIQEWSHNKAECPLCKQPFASILHSVRAEDDFKEYTLRPAPANSSVAATVAMVAAMASAARSDHQMRLMLRRHRGAGGGETTSRRRRRERGGRGSRAGVWEWYLDSPPLAPPPPLPPVVAEDSEDGEDLEEEPGMRGGADLAERGVIFEGLSGLGGSVAPAAPNDRASRRLMTRLVARQRLQREGGAVRRLRERETVAFRRALYRSGVRVRGVAGVSGNQGAPQRDITADSFRRNPTHLNRLRPWLRRELTVLYGAHGSLVDIVQRIIMARLARHGLEDTPTIEEELRPFLLARTDHFLHELISFARSPLSLENYDLQAAYEPPDAALELDGTSSSSDSSSVIAISEGEEEEERRAGGRSEERRAASANDDVIQAGSCLSLSAWDDETPGPSYSTAEPSCSLAPLSFSPAPQEAANEVAGEKEEEECLIVGYKKPMAERTPELVQLSSDTEEEEETKKKEEAAAEEPPPLPLITPPLSYLPTIPPSTSGTCSREQAGVPKETDVEAVERRSWSCSSGRSRNSVCSLSPATPDDSERRGGKSSSEAAREKRRKKRRKRGQERSGDRPRKSGTLYNPNRSIYPALMRRRSHSPSPFHSSVESGSPLPPSPPDSNWEYPRSQESPLASSMSPPSRSSSSSSTTAPTPSPLSPGDRDHHGEKPGGKRKYKSRHLDSDDKDPTWRPRREERRERGDKERRQRGREGRRKERRGGESSRKRREDRSPSVEIIYEGTIASNATQPPAHKRRRKHPRKTPHSSSPVIITLDSDSSNDGGRNALSSSSSPLSSQQTVDFSDLLPLPLVHSAGVGGALTAEIGELPVDILDRGSDGSEAEPAGRSEAAGPIAVDNSDNSDHDVDVENVEDNVEDNVSLLRSHVGKGPMRTAETNQREVEAVDDTAPTTTTTNRVRKTDSEVSTSDRHLLATILNDLKGISVPKIFKPGRSLDVRKKHFWDQSEVQSNRDDWSAEARHLNPYFPVDQNQGDNVPTCHASVRPPPPLERLKDVPPLLKQASPVRSYNRNTPPPLKHKDAGSPHLSPVSPVDLHSPNASFGVNSHVPDAEEAVPPISMLKRHFASALASTSANDMNPSCHLAPIDSHPSALSRPETLTGGIHSTSHKPPVDSQSAAPSKPETSPEGIHSTTHKPPVDSHPSSRSENSSTSVDRSSHHGFNSFHSLKLHFDRYGTKITSSSSPRSHIDLHPVNSSSPVDFHSAKPGWSKEKPARSDSTSRSSPLSPDSCRVAPVDLHPERGGGELFSGVNCNDTLPPVSVDSSTQIPSSPIDSHPPCRVRSVPTTAPRSSPIDPRSPKPTVDLHSSRAASEGLKENKSSGSPPVNVHSSSRSVGSGIDSNHTALSSQKKFSSTVESHSKLPRLSNHFDPRPQPEVSELTVDSQSAIDSHPKHSADNHVSSSRQPAELQWNSTVDAGSDSPSPVDDRPADGVWNTQTRSAT